MEDQKKRNHVKPIAQFIGGVIPIDSPLYINRPPIENQVYYEITQPGALLTISAPVKMGKSSLIARAIAHAASLDYRIVYLNFAAADAIIFNSSEQFMRWVCLNIGRQLDIKPKIETYWDNKLGSKISSTIYLQEYILAQINTPLVIFLEEFDWVLKHTEIAQEFLLLLRSWHDDSKRFGSFAQLRVVLSYASNTRTLLDIKPSSCDLGLSIHIPELNREQVVDLASYYGIDWDKGYQIKQLMDVVGGHPYLVNLALFYLSNESISIKKLLEDAPTLSGIYRNYLLDCLSVIQLSPRLTKALKQLVVTPGSVHLEAHVAYDLESIGIVKTEGNHSYFSCELYRQYFMLQLLYQMPY